MSSIATRKNKKNVSWPAHAGHPGDEALVRRADARRLGGPVKPGHDTVGAGKV
jgi:hypothetical protein